MGRSCLLRRRFPNRSVYLGYLPRPSYQVRRMRSPLGKADNQVNTGTKSIRASTTTTLIVADMEMRVLHQETAIPQTVSGMAARTGVESNTDLLLPAALCFTSPRKEARLVICALRQACLHAQSGGLPSPSDAGMSTACSS